jgi:hypothetical protein
MENVVHLFMIQALKAKLASCEREKSTLAREVLCPFTTPDRKIEALIHRAEVQTRSLCLLRELEALESDWSHRWILNESENELKPGF